MFRRCGGTMNTATSPRSSEGRRSASCQASTILLVRTASRRPIAPRSAMPSTVRCNSCLPSRLIPTPAIAYEC